MKNQSKGGSLKNQTWLRLIPYTRVIVVEGIVERLVDSGLLVGARIDALHWPKVGGYLLSELKRALSPVGHSGAAQLWMCIVCNTTRIAVVLQVMIMAWLFC